MASTILLVKSAAGIVVLTIGGLLWAVWAASAAYLLVLTAGAVLQPVLARRARKRSRTGSSDSQLSDSRVHKIGILVPAHNEELLLGGVLDELRALDYPSDSCRSFVIADNCTDGTAQVAREHGAEVLERTNTEQRGKGYALDWALTSLLPDPRG